MSQAKWWQRAVFYQIYPRSFSDSSQDGIGDLRGIIEKLDYLQSLSVDAIWLSPPYVSPQVDVGYDVQDYYRIDPAYGTIDDFKELLDGLHQRGIRLILDMVLNHTSDQNDWFVQSRSSIDNPYRDWYVWRDPAPDGGAPNNWESIFGGSAWTLDETTGQYFYHFFLKEQPDLNWRNPQVKHEMFNMLRFWLDMGVDGFRLDAINTVYEVESLPPHASPYSGFDVLKGNWLGRELGLDPREQERRVKELFQHQIDLPEIYTLMEEMRAVINEYDGRYLVGESTNVDLVGDQDHRLHSVFNWDYIYSDRLTPHSIRESQTVWLGKISTPATQGLNINNHDQSRVWTHYGDRQHDAERARLSCATVLTLPGIPFLYYGEEIGMQDYSVKSFDEVRDMVSDVYRTLMREEGKTDEAILADLATFSRDRCRTPMQWRNAPNGGFSPEGVQTWLPVHASYAHGVTVEDQEADPNSLLQFYRRLLAVRKASDALQVGSYAVYGEPHADYLAFTRSSAEQTCLVLMNFTTNPHTVTLPAHRGVLFGTHHDQADETVTLAPFEIMIVDVVA